MMKKRDNSKRDRPKRGKARLDQLEAAETEDWQGDCERREQERLFKEDAKHKQRLAIAKKYEDRSK